MRIFDVVLVRGKFSVSLWERPATSSLFQNTKKPHRSLADFYLFIYFLFLPIFYKCLCVFEGADLVEFSIFQSLRGSCILFLKKLQTVVLSICEIVWQDLVFCVF